MAQLIRGTPQRSAGRDSAMKSRPALFACPPEVDANRAKTSTQDEEARSS
jgi:hypothetical protein